LTFGPEGTYFERVRRFFVEAPPDDMNANIDKTETNGLVLTRKEQLELHERVLEEVRRMTPEEGFRFLVASGIYTPEGKLAKEYGG
jgi:uncharacterized protein (DUF2461 family)